MNEVLIRGAKIARGDVKDILIQDGVIVNIDDSIDKDCQLLDASGLRAFSGFVDLHTHLREPGFEQSETILSGSKAAAMGGYTAVNAMANTSPVADSAAVVEQIHRIGLEAGYVEVQPIGAISVGLAGKELAELGTMNKSAAAVSVFSDDGHCVSDSLLMKRALEYVKGFGGVIAQHAQDPNLTTGAQMNAGELAIKLGLSGWPSVAEASIVARDVLLTELTGSRLHVCHVSTKETVDVIRWAKSRGISVTAEVTPHHLLLTEDLVKDYNPIFKVNPPLRTTEDVLACRAALADGTIDIVATDHAPHPEESKQCDWASAANGMLGLETAASVVIETMVKTGLIDWNRFQEIMSIKPAEIAQMSRQGRGLKVGSPANIALLDVSSEHVVGSVSESLSSNNPYVGMKITGSVKHVLYKGTLTVFDSKIKEIGMS
ncbi:MAG: dihydroorotase [Rhodoluna sp.]